MIHYKTTNLSLDVDKMCIQSNGGWNRCYQIIIPLVDDAGVAMDNLILSTQSNEEYLQIDSAYTSDKAILQAMLTLRGINVDLSGMGDNLVKVK